jgi:hypothetical protein
MHRTITNIFMLAVGAAIGSTATWVYSQKKYSQLIQSEIEKTKEYYSDKESDKPEEPDIQDPEEEKQLEEEQKKAVQTSADIINQSGYDMNSYSDYTRFSKPKEEHPETVQKNLETFGSDENFPVVIAPESYGEIEDYATHEYTYFKDGVVVDDDGDVIDPEKVRSMLGIDFASHIGDFEADAVHIQNDLMKTYFEILAEPYDYND